MSSFSIDFWTSLICGFSWEPSLIVTAHEITERPTPQARPSAERGVGGQWEESNLVGSPWLTSLGWYKHIGHILSTMNGEKFDTVYIENWCVLLTLSSQSNGMWSRISKGSASAAMTMNSAIPRFKHFVAREKWRERNRERICWCIPPPTYTHWLPFASACN